MSRIIQQYWFFSCNWSHRHWSPYRPLLHLIQIRTRKEYLWKTISCAFGWPQMCPWIQLILIIDSSKTRLSWLWSIAKPGNRLQMPSAIRNFCPATFYWCPMDILRKRLLLAKFDVIFYLINFGKESESNTPSMRQLFPHGQMQSACWIASPLADRCGRWLV